MRAAIYARISDDRQGAGLGVARQEADCRALAGRNGWDVAEVFVDNDVSAYQRQRKRQAWTRMLDGLRAEEFDAVVAWHPDRMYRQMRDLLALIDLCDRGRVKVATVTAGDVDLSTATGRAVAKTVAAWNEHESEHKAERQRSKALELAQAGKVGNGGLRPFGYEADRVTIREDEAAIMRQLYADILAGRGLTTLAAELHAAGVKTTSGNAWTHQGLRYALLRARNAGWRSHHGKLIAPAVWPALVTLEEWEQARAMLTRPDRPNAGQSNARKYLLTGYVMCGLCGQPLRSARGTDLPRFSCRKTPGAVNCGRITVRYEPLEAHIVALVLARLERDSDLQPDPTDPADELRERIARVEGRLEKLADQFADEDGDVLEFRRAGQRLRQQIVDLRRQITDVGTRRRMSDPVEVRAAWPDYDLSQRRAVVGELIERVDIAPARVGLNHFDPNRLTVVWR